MGVIINSGTILLRISGMERDDDDVDSAASEIESEVEGAIRNGCAPWRSANIEVEVEIQDWEYARRTAEVEVTMTARTTVEYNPAEDSFADITSWVEEHAQAVFDAADVDVDATVLDENADASGGSWDMDDDPQSEVDAARASARVYRDSMTAYRTSLANADEQLRRIKLLVTEQGMGVNARALRAVWDTEMAHEVAILEDQARTPDPSSLTG